MEYWATILMLTIPAIFTILSTLQSAHAFTIINIDTTQLNLLDAQKSIAPYGVDMDRILMYTIVIAIVIFTRLKWTKHGRKVTKSKIIVESIFYLALSSIVIFDSIYNVGVPILYLIPYLFLFFGLQHYSYLHSDRFMSFWKESKSGSIYAMGGTHIHLAYVIGTVSRIIISVLFIGSLFTRTRNGLIYVDNSTAVLITIAFDMLLMVSVALLIGINRRILIRYNLIIEGKEAISEK
jgi:hypothetical protein